MAILNTGATENVISTKLMKLIKLASSINYFKLIGKASPNTIKTIGAYSTLTIRFEKIIIQSPAIVFNNENYDILIDTSFISK